MSRSYKYVPQKGTVSSVSDAYSELVSLGEECREIVDNAAEGLDQTQRIQTLDETAGELENLSEPDVPEHVADLEIGYSDSVPTRKGRSPSRATRRDNAVAILQGAISALEQKQADLEEIANADEAEAEPAEAAPATVNGDGAEPAKLTAEQAQEQADEIASLISELQDTVDSVESLDFPGMFG